MTKISHLLLTFFLALATFQAIALDNQYKVTSMHNFNNGNTQGIHADVVYTGTDEYYKLPSSPISQALNVTVTYDSDLELTILIEDPNNPRFKLPYAAPHPFTKPQPIRNPQYNVVINQNPFSVVVTRLTTGEVILDTSSFDFIYSEYFMTFGTKLPSKYLYGLGERRTNFKYSSGLYTIYNKDQFAQIDEGQGNQQTYGCHPMYLMREQSSFWNVVYLRNFNPMDFQYNADSLSLQYMLTGSVIELKVFLGSQMPDYVLQLYHNYINGWSLMPFWAHGYHQSKYGVLYFNDLYDVVSNFTTLQLPIDVIWSDIDYMYSFTDFTVDDQRYNDTEVKAMAEKIHWVPIVDAGVSLNSTADSYIEGMEKNVWIKSAQNNTNPLVGVVWPGVVHWVDWLNPNASEYWADQFAKFWNEDPFSGIWLDMNEYSNFCTGEFNNSCTFLADYLPDAAMPDGNHDVPAGDQNPNLPPSPWAWFNSSQLPYVPGGVPLEEKSLPINALHNDGTIELYVHNLEGLMESVATYKAIKNLTEERPFILSRSTTVGSGQFVAHWSGDNYADWSFLKYSVSCIFNFQMFGIPMSGDDICGFAGDTNEELCSRWMQLGAFYPFMRNHMAIGTHEHYPYSFGETLLKASMASLKFRYSILKYYYTLFVSNGGIGTVFRPVFFDFYDNDDYLLSLDTQFLIGRELMSGAIISSGQTELTLYLPKGARWFNFFTGELVHDVNDTACNKTFPAPLDGTLPVLIRAGSMVQVQNVDNVTNTRELDNVLNFVVALLPSSDILAFAGGEMLSISNYSNTTSVDQCINGKDCLISVSTTAENYQNGTIGLYVFFNAEGLSVLEDVYIGNITVYGVETETCDANGMNCVKDTINVVCGANDTPGLIVVPGMASFYIEGGVCYDDYPSHGAEAVEITEINAEEVVTISQ